MWLGARLILLGRRGAVSLYRCRSKGGRGRVERGTEPRAPWARRAAQKSRVLARHVRYNRAVMRQGTRGELTGDLLVSRGLTESQRC